MLQAGSIAPPHSYPRLQPHQCLGSTEAVGLELAASGFGFDSGFVVVPVASGKIGLGCNLDFVDCGFVGYCSGCNPDSVDCGSGFDHMVVTADGKACPGSVRCDDDPFHNASLASWHAS